MAESHYDWSRFVVRVNVAAPVNAIYEAWATRAGMENWFLRLSEYKRADGRLRLGNEKVEKEDHYKWLWHGWPDETIEEGVILDCNDSDFFKFSFGQAGTCAVTIKKECNETIVELCQENIPVDEQGKYFWHLGCKTGWTFYLANLKSMMEGGKDLRNKNGQLKNVINS